MDGWSGYVWMDSPNSPYLYIVHIHVAEDFGYGDKSASHIESLWYIFKYLIKKLYNMIPSK